MFHVTYAVRPKKDFLYFLHRVFSVRCEARMRKQLSIDRIIQHSQLEGSNLIDKTNAWFVLRIKKIQL